MRTMTTTTTTTSKSWRWGVKKTFFLVMVGLMTISIGGCLLMQFRNMKFWTFESKVVPAVVSSSNSNFEEENHHHHLSNNNGRTICTRNTNNNSVVEEVEQQGRRGKLQLVDQVQIRLCHAKPEMGYYCQGRQYDTFVTKLDGLLQEQICGRRRNMTSSSIPVVPLTNTTTTTTISKEKGPDWGQRFKVSPASNKTILFFGNSHMRQIFQTLACQYRNEQISLTSYESSYKMLVLPKNVTVIAITNHYIVYSPKWPELLSQVLLMGGQSGGDGDGDGDGRYYYPRRLQDFDAIVLGRFNGVDNSNGTTFELQMKNITANLTDISFENQPPPGIEDVAAVYKGPIILTSMFASYAQNHFHNEMRRVKKNNNNNITNPSRIEMINTRAYIPTLGECGNDFVQGGNGICLDEGQDNPKHRDPNNMHRCTGRYGGHPDLAVWDIIEALYRLL